jgi:putative copper export protein
LRQLALEAAPKAVLYGALLLAIGACAARWLLRARAPDSSAGHGEDFERRLSRVLVVSAAFLLVALAFRVWTHTMTVFGVPEGLEWDRIQLVAFQSRWGSLWRLQAIAALAVVASTLWIKVDRRTGWPAASLAVVICCFTLPLLGHAAGSPWRLALHAAHALGAGVWLGTVAAVLIAGASRAGLSSGESSDNHPSDVREILLRHLSPIAFSGAATLVASGLVGSLLYVGSAANLWTTPYGRLLTVKGTLFAGVIACGFLNWRRRSGGAGNGPNAAPRTGEPVGTATIEILLAAAVVIVTAVFTELEHP